jgi:hypothetical protein
LLLDKPKSGSVLWVRIPPPPADLGAADLGAAITREIPLSCRDFSAGESERAGLVASKGWENRFFSRPFVPAQAVSSSVSQPYSWRPLVGGLEKKHLIRNDGVSSSVCGTNIFKGLEHFSAEFFGS